MHSIIEQLKLHIIVTMRFYSRNRLVIVIAVILLFVFGLGMLPGLFFSAKVDKLNILVMLLNEAIQLFHVLLALIALLTISYHLNVKCVKVIFTKPCLPDVWVLAQYLSAFGISACLFGFALISGLVFAGVWGLPVSMGLAAFIFIEFSKSLIIISCCFFLATLMHPVVAVLFIIGLSAVNEVRLVIDMALKNIANEVAMWMLKAGKILLDAIYILMPAFSPYEHQVVQIRMGLKIQTGQPQYFLLIFLYALLVSVLCYFLTLYTVKKKLPSYL